MLHIPVAAWRVDLMLIHMHSVRLIGVRIGTYLHEMTVRHLVAVEVVAFAQDVHSLGHLPILLVFAHIDQWAVRVVLLLVHALVIDRLVLEQIVHLLEVILRAATIQGWQVSWPHAAVGAGHEFTIWQIHFTE